MGCRHSIDAVRVMDPIAPEPVSPCQAPRDSGVKNSPVLTGELPLEWKLQLHRRQGDVLGAGLGNTDKGAVIFDIQENGLLNKWNRDHDLHPLRPGLIITEVNGITGYWDILGELQKPGILNIKVTAEPPWNAGSNWFQDITEMGKRFQDMARGGKSPFMLRLKQEDPGAKPKFSSLPTVRAGDCGVDQCAICIDDVAPDESLVQLPCGHAFHALCAARWLTQAGRHSQGKRQCCPLCCRKVLSSPGGGFDATDWARGGS